MRHQYNTTFSQSQEALTHALALSRMGWSIIPLQAQSKVPLINWKAYQTRKLTDREIISIFEQTPDANVGVVTGRVSNLLVLDCDAPDALRRMGKGIPETVISQTSRGQHYYFRLPNAKIRSVTIADGLEIKAQGSLVVAPPSIHPSGARYNWLIPPLCFEWGADPAPAPDWLMELIHKHRDQKVNIKSAIHGVDEGVRNRSTATVAGKLLAALRPDDWESVAWPLVLAWNTQNKPPLPMRELRQVFESVAKSELKQRSGSTEARLLSGLRKLSLKLRLSQRSLSWLMGIPQPTLSRWLTADAAPYTYIKPGGESKKSMKIGMEANFNLKSDSRQREGGER